MSRKQTITIFHGWGSSVHNYKEFAETKEINTYNPIDKIACSSPILLMHREQDTIVSIESQKDYFNYLTESDTVHDVIFNIYNNVNHSFSEEMMEYLKRWLVKKFLVT